MFIFVCIASVYIIVNYVPEPNETTDDDFVRVQDNEEACL